MSREPLPRPSDEARTPERSTEGPAAGRASEPEAPDLPLGFDGLALTPDVAGALAAAGITAATPVQTAAIGPILAGRSTLLRASTGTGKTLAYLLPILERLRDPEAGRAVIVAPGVELALQTLRVAEAFRDPAVSVARAVATTNSRRERDQLQRSTRLVVGTPARIFELFREGRLKGTRILVLDEPEPILAAAGSEALDAWLARSEPRLQLVVATATLGPRALALVERHLGPEAARIEPTEAALPDTVRHLVVRVPPGVAPDLVLARFLQEHRCRRAIVFTSDPGRASHLFHALADHGHRPVTVTPERGKAERRAGLDAFRDGQARVLILSDATGRGLDVPGVAWVIHLDVPSDPQVYAQRAGRTGRAGAPGTSVVLAADADRARLRRIGEALGIGFEPAPRARAR